MSPAAPDEQRCTESVHQLCDMAMALVKAMVDRVTQGKPVEVGVAVWGRDMLGFLALLQP